VGKPRTLETLVIMAQAPGSPGGAARLRQEVGDQNADRLLAAFLADLSGLAARWRARATPPVTRHVAVYVPDTPDDAFLQEAAACAGARVVVHSGEDVASQVAGAVADELDRGAERVLVLGPQAPSVPVHLLDEALRACCFHAVVLGPTLRDGLWGLSLQRQDLAGPGDREGSLARLALEGFSWGESNQVARCVDRLGQARVEPHLLPYWMDVSWAEDLPRLTARLGHDARRGRAGPSLTPVVLASLAPFPVPPPAKGRGAKRP
jgi:glycosyltransferase A (GT-A) superfamily protein (DUF2064 family)